MKQLSFFTLFTLFLTLNNFAYANDTKITLQSGEIIQNCIPHEETLTYYCDDKGRKIVITGSKFSPTAHFYENDKIYLANVTEITEGETEIFKTSTLQFPGFYGASTPTSENSLNPIPTEDPMKYFKESISFKLMDLNSFKASLDNAQSQGFEYPDSIAQIRNPILTKLSEQISTLSNLMSRDNVIIHTKNGSELNCQRQKTDLSIYDTSTLNNLRAIGREPKCLLFSCSPSEKNQDIFLMFDNNPGSFADVLTLKNNEFDNSDQLSYIETTDRKNILADNRDRNLAYNPLFAYQKEPELTPDDFIPRELIQYEGHFKKMNYPGYQIAMQFAVASCEKNDYQKISSANQKFNEALAQAELTQYITLLNDDAFGYFISPEAIPEIACHSNGTYYNPEAYKKLLERGEIQNYTKKSITLDRAKELFEKAKNMNNIAWNYTADGCYARAHLMAREFESEGVDVQKAWIKGDLSVTTSERTNSWNFHVAPALEVDQGDGTTVKYIIDPSIADGPITVDEWTSLMTDGRVDITGFPYPLNSTSFNRASLTFTDTNTYMPSEFKNFPQQYATEEERMNAANETMLDYKERKNEIFMPMPNFFQ